MFINRMELLMLSKEINLIMKNDFLDTDDCASSKTEYIESLINKCGWENVQEVLFLLLMDDSRTKNEYVETANVFWGAALDKRDINSNKAIALLYYRLNELPDISNLLWSITCELRSCIHKRRSKTNM